MSAKLIIVSEHIREIFNELDASSEVVEFRLTFYLHCRLFEYRALWWPAFSWLITGKDLKSRYARIWNGQKEVAFNWSRFWMGSEIHNPNHLKTDKNGHHLVFTIWNLDNLVRILYESDFQIIETKAIAIDKAQPFEIQPSKSPDFKCFRILNGQISDTTTIWNLETFEIRTL